MTHELHYAINVTTNLDHGFFLGFTLEPCHLHFVLPNGDALIHNMPSLSVNISNAK